MAYIDVDKDFDLRTLEVLMYGDDEEKQELIERNVRRFSDAHTVQYSEATSELTIMVNTYRSRLQSRIESTRNRLKSTMNAETLSLREATDIFIHTLNAVRTELENFNIKSVLSEELSEIAEDIFEGMRNDSLQHLSMFIKQYTSDLSGDSENYMKKYVYTLIEHGYLFELRDRRLSLLVFLSFYEAYVNRIIGLTLIQAVKDHESEIQVLLSIDELGVEQILNYAETVSVPDAKNCCFTEFQKWFKDDILEFVKRFLIKNVDKAYHIPYQKSSLIDKRMLRSDKCLDTPLPPIIIPSPQTIKGFFLISDSHFMIM